MATFSVTATGPAPLSYQWRKATVPIIDATNSTYTIGNVQWMDAGVYDVLVSNSCGAILSSNATLTTTGGSTQLTLYTLDKGWYSHSGLHIPSISNYVAGKSGNSTYRNWFVFDVPPSTGNVTQAELLIHAYNIATTSAFETFELHEVATPIAQLTAGGNGLTNIYNDLGDGTVYGNRNVLASEAGQVLTVPLNAEFINALTGAGGAQIALGGLLPTLDPMQANEFLFGASGGSADDVRLRLTFEGCTPPVITNHPLSQTVPVGGMATFSVTAIGTAPLTYQWRKATVPVTGATNSAYSIAGVQPADAGTYDVLVSNSCGMVFSAPATLTVTPTVVGLVNGSFETGDFTGWLTNDLTQPLHALTVRPGGFNPGYGLFISQPTDGLFAATHGFDGNGPGTIRIAQEVTVPVGVARLAFDYRVGWDLVNYSSNAQPRVFRVVLEPVGGGAVLAAFTNLVAMGNTQNPDTGPINAAIDLGAFAGSDVRLVFEAIIPQSYTGPGFFQLDHVRFEACPTPVIVVQPAGQTVPVGGTATLNVTATGTGLLSYQWRKASSPIAGATNSAYSIANVQLTHAGEYDVLVSNDCGSVLSSNATLTVLPLVSGFVNGSFETGDFTGWLTNDLGYPFSPLTVRMAGYTPWPGFFSSLPSDGYFAATHGFDGDGPGTIWIAQDLVVPTNTPLLSFDYRAAWDLITYSTNAASRVLRVVVQPAGGGAVLAAFTNLVAQGGTQNMDTGPTTATIDLTPFVGTGVRVGFEAIIPQSFAGPGFMQWDNVRLHSAQPGQGFTFANPAPHIIQGAGAQPYPSTILVSNLGGWVDGVTVTLSNLAHTWPDDLDILLVGPHGQTLMLMSDAIGDDAYGVTNLTLTFDDNATSGLPQLGPVTSGVYRPTDFDLRDLLPMPAPLGPYGTNLNALINTNANGLWSLYIADDYPPSDDGILADGWSLHFDVSATYPVLSVHLVAGTVVLSWPAAFVGQLETTTQLEPAAKWTLLSPQPMTLRTDGQNLVTLPVTPGQRFYRLRGY